MKPRETIFDSLVERDVFQAISGSWEPSYRVYPHVPYANLIELDQHRLPADEVSFLHHTSVDFVLTANGGKPLLGIEFDGLGHGFSHNGRYVGFIESRRDRTRSWKLNLKVRVANDAGFPFIVVSYDESAVIDPDTNLLVLHGIVGSFLSSHHLGSRIAELVKENEDHLSELSAEDAQDEIQDMVIGAEIDLDMEWNPVTRRGVELQRELTTADPSAHWSYSYLEDPVRPGNCFPHSPSFDPVAFGAWWNNILKLGCRYTVETRAGTIVRSVWLRNYDGNGLTPFGLLEELAQVVTLREALALVSQ